MNRTLAMLERHEMDRAAFWKSTGQTPSPAALKAWELSRDAVFTFRTQAMKDLWDEELRGQITDGHWESGARTGDLFWYDVPTKVGSSTKLTGKIPNGARKNFNFADKTLVRGLKDRMLDYVHKSQPDATEADLVDMLKEITKAVKAAKQDPIRSGETRGSSLDDLRKEVFWKANLKGRVEPSYEMYLVGAVPGRFGKFHYFVVLQDKDAGEYVGLSAYGTEGKKPKSVVIARGPDMAVVTAKVDKKYYAKRRKYAPAELPEAVGQGWRTKEMLAEVMR